MFPKTGSYVVNARDTNTKNKCNNDRIWTITKEEVDPTPYTYDEAINLTGQGLYSLILLFAGCFGSMGLTLDQFALPAISSIAACELKIGTYEEKIIMTIPFIGAILMAFPWGYIADTRGRRIVLLGAVWCSFIASCLAAFSQHWVMLALLKFLSVSCSTSMDWSIGFILIGESCATRVKMVYFFIMTSCIHITFPIRMALHYFMLTLDFSVDLGMVTFTPWRLLAILLALPLAGCAICLHFLHESPKFLVSVGKEDEALEILTNIWHMNGQRKKKPVLHEELSTFKTSEVSLLQSLWNQTIPLFRMPMLLRTMQLFFLIFLLYFTCSGLLSWFPFLADAFISSSLSSRNSTEGLCNMISQYSALKNSNHSSVSCKPKSNLIVVWASLAQGVALVFINCSVSLLAHRRKLLMTIILLIPGLAALGSATLPNSAASLTAYFTIFLAVVGLGVVLSYCVDLYSTSYRGMLSCLVVLMARVASIAGINVIGSLIMEHCQGIFLLFSGLFFCGVLTACFLPSDKQTKA